MEIGTSKLKLNIDFNTCSVVRLSSMNFALHFGVYPEEGSVYKVKDGKEEYVEYPRWLWGRGTEVYDHCLEYFGVGPLALVVWVP